MGSQQPALSSRVCESRSDRSPDARIRAERASRRLARRDFSNTFPRVTPPMTPRVDRAANRPPERRALQDALAWPIAATLLVGAGIVVFLPRFVPPRFLALAVGGIFALTTVALIAILAFVVERWLRRHAAALAIDAERQVQTLGIAGLPTATDDGALIPLASAFADAGARAALLSAEREASDLLAQLGSDIASTTEHAMARVRTAIDEATLTPDARAALTAIDATSTALRRLTAAVPAASHAVDVVAEVRAVIASLPPTRDAAELNTIIDADRGMVLIDRARLHDHLLDLLRLARAASPADGAVTLHLSRIFRSSIEETPVRRTGDSRLTIVPRASGDALRTWVQRAQPGAELLSIVITDAGRTPSSDEHHRALDAFALARAGDPLGVSFATIRRTIAAANGTMWIDGSREGGTAVHLLLPIASG